MYIGQNDPGRGRTAFSGSAMIERRRGRSLPFMNIVDLRQTTVRQIEPLLEEESLHWRDELHWDYRGALELIKRFLEAHALSGCVAYENGSAAGYSFYVMEETKGLIGGLYVSPQFNQAGIARRLLEEMLYGMRTLPNLSRDRKSTRLNSSHLVI